ncbi:hypothetical protein O6H91_10G058200 [Diphasiastrum complanatum]|uniref:Uncharacterized protein n=1 Tax=Diphasiastrum complanatum TaxID=34168 RepID=A0ACC2CHI6_DIPCM|nr:hypothetical protein O6H91_10G058200 [Diphasiastrum complanatum]
MALFASLAVLTALLINPHGLASACTFTIVNGCSYQVWPAILPTVGSPMLANGGFALAAGQSSSLTVPFGWSGRMWARTGCQFDSGGQGSCLTGDCGNKLQCNGIGGEPPASLVEITLNGAAGLDFYDVSLVDGFNVPLNLCPSGGSGACTVAGCVNNINYNCPAELQLIGNGQVVACKSACLAFNSPQYCCTGAYTSSCGPTRYSQIFKSACPAAYSYAKDDPSSLYTCKNPYAYTITFCPARLSC